MNGAQETRAVGAPEAAPKAAQPSAPRHRDTPIYILLAVLVLAAWQFTRLGLFTSASDAGYWIGVAGGSMMLLLFTYPMRKRWRFMRNLGAARWWFIAHMTLGIAGPLLVLVHSTFQTGSLNAAVALYSMLIVAGSGVVGRFLYVRIHRNLHGEMASFAELRTVAGFQHDAVRSRLHFVPAVEARLFAFELMVLGEREGASRHLWNVTTVPFRQFATYWWCAREIDACLAQIGAERGWSSGELRARRAKARAIVFDYLASIVRVAQFGTFVRLFALWHVAHVPFVYVMVISAVAHVVAVHIY